MQGALEISMIPLRAQGKDPLKTSSRQDHTNHLPQKSCHLLINEGLPS